uniref:Uncharacterized protein n=1 Tax=Onchocerca volvulus TaxID=6282 RepID=A0A8R1TXN2_ONCVO
MNPYRKSSISDGNTMNFVSILFLPHIYHVPVIESTVYRFGLFPSGGINLDLGGTTGLSQGLLVGRAAGNALAALIGK